MTDTVFDEVPRGAYNVLRLALKTALLPIDDLDEPNRTFYQLSDDTDPIGYVGLEGTGADRLLRSLVLFHTRKRQGFGAQILSTIERWAVEDGVERLHLLTTGKAAFFKHHGYAIVDRASAPEAIATTAQFAAHCPTSAAYLVKDIA